MGKSQLLYQETGLLPLYAFREYDIRAVYGKDLFDHHAFTLGQTFGTIVQEIGHTEVVVGRDGRLSSPTLCQQLMEGLQATGIQVTYVGVGPSPYIYYCEKKLKPGAAVMVTASHNGREYNGFKIILEGKSFFGQDLSSLYARMNTGDFKKGKGTLRHQSLHDDYCQRLLEEANHYTCAHPLTVVWDAGNGAAAEITQHLVKSLPGNHLLINGEMDGTFPNHDPDPTQPENCAQLLKTMHTYQADLGIAFDGDGDRLVVIDNKGYILTGDELLLLFAQEVLVERPGAVIIGDVKASQNLWDAVKQWGGKGLMGRTGHSLIKTLMRETQAPLAGEMSGHFFFADRYYGYDDGLYAAVRAWGILGDMNQSLSAWRQQFPVLYTSPEFRLACPNKFQVLGHLKDRLREQKLPFNDMDGVRVSTPQGWWLLRVSHTQEAVSARLESSTPAGLQALRTHMNQLLAPMQLAIPSVASET